MDVKVTPLSPVQNVKVVVASFVSIFTTLDLIFPLSQVVHWLVAPITRPRNIRPNARAADT